MAKLPKKAPKKLAKQPGAAPGLGQAGKQSFKQFLKNAVTKKVAAKKVGTKKAGVKKANVKKAGMAPPAAQQPAAASSKPPYPLAPTGEVLDRLHAVVLSRRDVDPALSHSARLLSRGPAKVAQKFGEEAVETLIEAVAGNKPALIGESADVLYHLLVLWVATDVRPEEVWAELQRREGVSGVAEKASRLRKLPALVGTTKIP